MVERLPGPGDAVAIVVNIGEIGLHSFRDVPWHNILSESRRLDQEKTVQQRPVHRGQHLRGRVRQPWEDNNMNNSWGG